MPTEIDAAVLLVAILAAGISAVSAYVSWRSSQSARAQASAALQSAQAAERSAAVAERSEQRELEEAERRAVSWRPERTGTKIRFWNDGTDIAYDVEVTATAGASTFPAGPGHNVPTLHPGNSIDIEVRGRKMAPSADEQFDVVWRVRPGGEVKHWPYRP